MQETWAFLEVEIGIGVEESTARTAVGRKKDKPQELKAEAGVEWTTFI